MDFRHRNSRTRRRSLGEIPNLNSVVDTLKSAQQTVQDTVDEIKADVERVQKTATYTAYGLLGFGVGVAAYLLFSDRK